MNRLQRTLMAALVALAFVAIAAGSAFAQTSIKVGGLRTLALLPVSYGIEKGYFKREGLDVELVYVNSGPAVISALLSDSVQIGYSASLPVLFARAQHQPVRIFTVFEYETSQPGGQWTWLVASERSGVKSVKDLAGKTVAINASGALCELQVREHLAKAGVAWDAVKKIIVPFPQMQAALQLGNADAACVVEPFRTQARVSPGIKAATLGAGALADGSPRWALDVLFAREDWGRVHKDELRRFNKGLAWALDDFRKQPGVYRQQIIDGFKLGPAVVSLMKSDVAYTTDLQPHASDIQPLVDGLKRNGLLTEPMKAEDLILPLN